MTKPIPIPTEYLPLWRCFVCGSEAICSHREPAVVAWWRELNRENLAARAEAAKPKPRRKAA